jgi:hypothetical protein
MWSRGDVVVLRYRSIDGRFRSGRPLTVVEEPHVFGERTIDTRDGILDVWVPAGTGEPQWKDEHELDAAIGQGRVTADEARAIRAEGERVIAERPWPTGWEDFEPDPSRPVPELPPDWDRH